MSRTKRGGKPFGYDYWSKRPCSGLGYGKHIKDMCHSVERMQSKEILLNENTSKYSTDDYPNVVKYFEKKGITIEIVAEHPCNLDVIFDKVSGKWLGYVDDFCLLHEEMYCEKCFEY